MKKLHYKLNNYIEKKHCISSEIQKIFQFNIYLEKDKIGQFEISIDLFITFADLYIKPEYRGKGYASIIIKQINKLLNNMALDFKMTDLFLNPHTYDKSKLNNNNLKDFYIKNLGVKDISKGDEKINLFKAYFI